MNSDAPRVSLRALAAFVVTIALFASTICVAASAPPGDETPQRATRFLSESVSRLGLQTELKNNSAEELKPRFNLKIPREVASFVFYGALVVMLLVILKSSRDNLWSFSRSKRLEAYDVYESAPVAEVSRMKVQLEVDELARSGNFAEAMHVMLLQSVDEMRGLHSSISASMTSREILRRVELSAEGRLVFADIVSRVEISYFGKHLPRAEEYFACRESFDTLTGLLRRGLVS